MSTKGSNLNYNYCHSCHLSVLSFPIKVAYFSSATIETGLFHESRPQLRFCYSIHNVIIAECSLIILAYTVTATFCFL